MRLFKIFLFLFFTFFLNKNLFAGGTTLNKDDSGNYTIAAGEALSFNGSNITYSGKSTINGGSIINVKDSGANSITNDVTLGANSTISIVDGSLEISGTIQGSYGFDKTGSGTLTLSGTNFYTGATTISTGQLTVSGSLADSTAVTVSSGATYELGASDTIGSVAGAGTITLGSFTLNAGGDNSSTEVSGIISGKGALTKSGSGTLILSGSNTYTGLTTINAGTIDVSSQLNSGNHAGNIANSGTLIYSSNSDQTLSGIISGTGALTKSGSGTLTLSGSNTYSGSTTISAGTLVMNGSGSIDSNTIEIDSGAILQVNVTDSLSSGATITVTGTFDVNENNTILKLNGAGSTDIASGKTLTVASSSGFTGEFTGLGKLAFSGGTTTLKASNSYSGGTDISGGVVMIEDDTAVGSGKITLTGGKLSSNNTTARSLDEDVDIQGTIELGDSSNTGTLTLGGTNRLTGNTTLTNDSAVIIAALSGSSDLSKSGSGTLTITGDSAYTGATTISNGKLRITGRIGSSGTYAGTVANSGELEINSSDDQIMTGVISGTGTLKKDGSGTLTLRGVNTQTGLVTVSGGLLYAGTAADNGKTIVAGDVRVNGGTLGGGGTIGGNVNASGGSLAPGNSIGTLTIDGDLTLDSSSTTNIELDASSADKIIVNGTIDLDGALSLTVTNATYSDTTYTIIQGGTLSDGDTFASLVGGDSSNFNGGSASLSYDYDNNLVQLVITASSSSGSVRSNTSTNSLKTLADIFDNSTASTLSSLKTYWVSNSGVVDSELKEAKGTVLATSLVQAQKTHNAFQKAVSNVTSMGVSSPVGNFTRSGSSNLSLAELQESGLYGDRNNWSEHYDYSDTSVLGFLKNNKNKTLVSAFTSNDSAAFIRTYGAKTKRDNIGSDYTGYQNDTYGILFGEQYKMSEGNFNGYSYGLSGSDTDYNDSYGESRTYSAHSSIFKQIDEKNHAVNLIAGGYLSHTSSKRNVSVGGGIVNDTYKSSTNDFGVNASAQYTKKIKFGGWQLSPSMSLQGSYEFKDDINESGGDLALNVKNENLITLKPELGFSLDRNFSDNIDVVDQFNFSIFASQDHYIDGTTSSAKYTSDSTAFNMNAPKDHEEYVSVGLGYNFIDKKNDSNLIANIFHTESTDNDLKSNVFSVTYRKLFGGFGKGKIPPVIVQSPNKDKDEDKGVVAKTIEKVTKTLVYKKPICRPGQVYKNDRCTADEATLQLVAAKLHQIQKVEPTLGLIALRYYVEFTKFIPLITFVMFIILIYEIIRMLAVKLYRKKMFNRNFE